MYQNYHDYEACIYHHVHTGLSWSTDTKLQPLTVVINKNQNIYAKTLSECCDIKFSYKCFHQLYV